MAADVGRYSRSRAAWGCYRTWATRQGGTGTSSGRVGEEDEPTRGRRRQMRGRPMKINTDGMLDVETGQDCYVGKRNSNSLANQLGIYIILAK
jgi:hypothetical protein